jgi:hypothetical protein
MKSTLQEMLRQIRGFTRKLLDETNPEWIHWAPEGTSNHMLWHAGHAIWVQDLLCVQKLTGETDLDEEWGKKFGMDCEPVAAQKSWPAQSEVAELLAKQQVRLHELLEAMTPEQLVIQTENDRDVVGGIIHGLHDEAKHHGEMYLLHKLCAARTNES